MAFTPRDSFFKENRPLTRLTGSQIAENLQGSGISPEFANMLGEKIGLGPNFAKQMEDTRKSLQGVGKEAKQVAATMVKWAIIIQGLRTAGAAAVAVGEQQLRQRLRERGDFGKSARRELGGSGAENFLSSIPGLGFIKQLGQQSRESQGFNDAADAAELLARKFTDLRSKIDQTTETVAAQELAIKFRFNPEQSIRQQALLRIKLGPGADVAEIEELRKSVDDREKELVRQLGIPKGQPGFLSSIGFNSPRARARAELGQVRKRQTQINAPNVNDRLEALRGGVGRLGELANEQFRIDQLVGSRPTSVQSFAGLGVAGALSQAGETDPIVQKATRTNDLLAEIRDLLEGQNPGIGD